MHATLGHGDLGDEDRLHFEFALGKMREDQAAYEESFAHYARGNALRRKSYPYSAEENSDFIRRSKALFTTEFFASRAGSGCPASDPIFIVGLPRAGSTLLEQILASHSLVEGTMELPEVHLRPRGSRALLPRLLRPDGALRSHAAEQDPPRHLRDRRGRHGGRGAPPARLLQSAL